MAVRTVQNNMSCTQIIFKCSYYSNLIVSIYYKQIQKKKPAACSGVV